MNGMVINILMFALVPFTAGAVFFEIGIGSNRLLDHVISIVLILIGIITVVIALFVKRRDDSN